jgi:hypothetical protein
MNVHVRACHIKIIVIIGPYGSIIMTMNVHVRACHIKIIVIIGPYGAHTGLQHYAACLPQHMSSNIMTEDQGRNRQSCSGVELV